MDLRDARLELRHRAAALGMVVSRRAHAVEPRAAAHRVAPPVGIAHHADAVQQMGLGEGHAAVGKLGLDLRKAGELLLVALPVVQRQMGEQTLHLKAARAVQRRDLVCRAAAGEAQPVQPRVQLYMDAHGQILLPGDGGQRFALSGGIQREHRPAQVQPPGLPGSHMAEHQHVRAGARVHQLLGLVAVGYGEDARAGLEQRRADHRRAHAVGVGLEHADDLPGHRACLTVVFAQRVQINLRPAAGGRFGNGHGCLLMNGNPGRAARRSPREGRKDAFRGILVRCASARRERPRPARPPCPRGR